METMPLLKLKAGLQKMRFDLCLNLNTESFFLYDDAIVIEIFVNC